MGANMAMNAMGLPQASRWTLKIAGLRPYSGFGLLVLAFLGSPLAAHCGNFEVIDSATVSVDGAYYRLSGINSVPEGRECKAEMDAFEPCDQLAVKLLSQLGTNAEISCEPMGDTGYGLVLAQCLTTDGKNIAAVLVRSGLALSENTYFSAEQQRAKSDRAGIWGLHQ
ncbi:MAG: thermonuclease family protein [Nitratireductor sp.]|nr:thermonuclease family protein [Nitratireductor sp.]